MLRAIARSQLIAYAGHLSAGIGACARGFISCERRSCALLCCRAATLCNGGIDKENEWNRRKAVKRAGLSQVGRRLLTGASLAREPRVAPITASEFLSQWWLYHVSSWAFVGAWPYQLQIALMTRSSNLSGVCGSPHSQPTYNIVLPRACPSVPRQFP